MFELNIEYSDIENLHVGKLAGRNIIILVSTKCSINKTNKCVLQYKKQSSRMVVQYHNCGKSRGKENMHNICQL